MKLRCECQAKLD